MNWKRLLESTSESVNDHLRLRNAYLLAENRILRQQIDGRMQLTESERKELAEIGVKLGKQALAEIATIVTPDTILAWHRTFADQQVDTSKPRKSVGRPRIDKEIEDLVVRMARENRSWGYDRIASALANLGYTVSDQTVGNILKRHGIPPAPERKKTLTWWEFVRFHLDVLLATDFFHSKVWHWFGLLISSLAGFLHISRHQGHGLGLRLYRQMHGRRSVLIQSLNLSAHAQSWSCWVKTGARSQTMRCGTALLGRAVAAGAPFDTRPPQSHEMDKVVRLSAVSPGLIRAGPLRYRHRFRGPSHGNDCKAA
jgi:transposase